MKAMLAGVRALWEREKNRKGFLSFSNPDKDVKNDSATSASANNALLRNGRVVWAWIARAFFPSYMPGVNTHYGSVVYAMDENEPDSLPELWEAVNRLRDPNVVPPKGCEKLAIGMRTDRNCTARLLLPPELGALGESYFADMCILRTRLPGGYLHRRLVPILAASRDTEACCILPLRGWTPEFKQLWLSGPPAFDPRQFSGMLQKYKVTP